MADNLTCARYEGYSPLRFTLLSLASIVACIGMVCNAILSWLFLGPRRTQFSTNTFYQGVLAVFDCSLCCFYVAIFEVDAFAYFLNMQTAYDVLFIYLQAAFVSSRITQLVIPYLLVVATLERTLSMYDRANGLCSCLSNRVGRKIIVTLLTISAILLRLPMTRAMALKYYPDCANHLRSKELTITPFGQSDFYMSYDLYFITAIQTLLPFLELLFMNIMIIYKMNVTRRAKELQCMEQHISSLATRKRALSLGETLKLMVAQELIAERVKIRSAISTVAIISSSHLIINSMNLVLVFFERFYESFLLITVGDQVYFHPLYVHFGDVLSFLFVVTSVVRLPIYTSCNQEVRTVLKQFIKCTPIESDVTKLNRKTAIRQSVEHGQENEENRWLLSSANQTPSHGYRKKSPLTSTGSSRAHSFRRTEGAKRTRNASEPFFGSAPISKLMYETITSVSHEKSFRTLWGMSSKSSMSQSSETNLKQISSMMTSLFLNDSFPCQCGIPKSESSYSHAEFRNEHNEENVKNNNLKPQHSNGTNTKRSFDISSRPQHVCTCGFAEKFVTTSFNNVMDDECDEMPESASTSQNSFAIKVKGFLDIEASDV